MWLSRAEINDYVYINEASPYLILLVAAYTQPSVKLFIPHYMNIELIRALLKRNSLDYKMLVRTRPTTN